MTPAQQEAVRVAAALFEVSARKYRSGIHETSESLLWQARADTLRSLATADSIEAVMQDATAWADVQFPDSTLQSIANHLLLEAVELVKQPTDVVELADVLLLAGHLVKRTGINAAAVMRAKLDVNKLRRWGPPDEHGVSQHVQ